MIDSDTRDYSRFARNWILALVFGLMVLGGLSVVVSAAFNLAWYPWQIKMQTGMIRNSNSYVTTQQTALRQLRVDYEDASTDGQKLAIKRQMRQLADLIPGEVQPDIRSFLAGSN